MKILSSAQIRELDAYTIAHEPISSIDLMERAATSFVDWFMAKFPQEDSPICIFCGPGNNGGDGLAIARMLSYAFYEVELYLCAISPKQSADFQTNLKNLPQFESIPITELSEGDPLPPLPPSGILIDALLGTGISRPLEGYWADFVQHLSQFAGTKIAVDLPSGLNADSSTNNKTFCADYTFSFEFPKLAFLLPENDSRVGEWAYASIGLHPEKIQELDTHNFYLQQADVQTWVKKRSRYAHKGLYGHALLIAGSQGMMGAALLSGRAILRSGTGLLTIHAPACGYPILQMGLPEAMVSSDRHQFNFSEMPELGKYSAVGIGCGLGNKDFSIRGLDEFLGAIGQKPLVIDADALNIIAQQKWQQRIPRGAILSPHPKEFSRLFGDAPDDFARLDLLRETAVKYGLYIIRKGAHTAIALPDGQIWFNSSGNPGMATGGSGDVLTGILTGLLAQGYDAAQTCKLGVYLHGLAGDIAATKLGHEALLASDIVDHIGVAFQFLKKS
ncbi:NAD(P)H-hydrate dehydratase [Haliscomenobacter sp.]|uniref:NAD(P)H-hydrate dehydratase n=1 Tax=Haliscomenobacter sp. TaxID=2717303 RepID=UPI0035948EBB